MHFDKILNSSERIMLLANSSYSPESREILDIIGEEIESLTEDSIKEAAKKISDKEKIYSNLVKVSAYRDVFKLIEDAKEKIKESSNA